MSKLKSYGRGKAWSASLACLAVAAGAAISAADEPATSQPATFFANAPESYLWHSIPEGATTVYWDMPETAHSATVTIEGANYSSVQSGITGESCVLSIPQNLSTPRGTREDVFKVTLSFDDGSSQTAYLGAVTGLGASGTATTPRIKLDSAPNWGTFQDYAAIAVLPGATSLTVNGEPLPDLDGNAGWRLLHYDGASRYDLAMALDGVASPILASVTGFAGGTFMIFR